jgi:hypothetical protein
MSVSIVLFIAFALWGVVIPGAVVGLRLRRAAAADRRLAPAPAAPRACERRARRSAPPRLVTRAH